MRATSIVVMWGIVSSVSGRLWVERARRRTGQHTRPGGRPWRGRHLRRCASLRLGGLVVGKHSQLRGDGDGRLRRDLAFRDLPGLGRSLLPADGGLRLRDGHARALCQRWLLGREQDRGQGGPGDLAPRGRGPGQVLQRRDGPGERVDALRGSRHRARACWRRHRRHRAPGGQRDGSAGHVPRRHQSPPGGASRPRQRGRQRFDGRHLPVVARRGGRHRIRHLARGRQRRTVHEAHRRCAGGDVLYGCGRGFGHDLLVSDRRLERGGVERAERAGERHRCRLEHDDERSPSTPMRWRPAGPTGRGGARATSRAPRRWRPARTRWP